MILSSQRRFAGEIPLSSGVLAEPYRLLSLIWGDRLVRQVLAVVLGVILAIILVFTVSGIWSDGSELAHIVHSNFHLSEDGSLAENFNHGIAFVAAFLLLASAIQTRSRVFVFLTLLYGFIWLDDSARYHERVGEKLGRVLDIQPHFGLGAQEYGELLAWTLAGAVLAVVLLWAWAGRRRGDVGVLLPFLGCFVLLFLCGVVADVVHKWVPEGLNPLFQVIEDGGEMIAVALGAALAFGTLRHVEAYYAGVEETSG
ncbi:hypothetical protein NBRC116599_28680 [Aquicoccus sp. SU-CL01552]